MEKKSKFFWLKIVITIISFGGALFFKSNIDWSNIHNNRIDLSLFVFVNKKVLQKGVKKVSTFNTQ